MATRIVTIDDEIDGENEVVEVRVVVLGVGAWGGGGAGGIVAVVLVAKRRLWLKIGGVWVMAVAALTFELEGERGAEEDKGRKLRYPKAKTLLIVVMLLMRMMMGAGAGYDQHGDRVGKLR